MLQPLLVQHITIPKFHSSLSPDTPTLFCRSSYLIFIYCQQTEQKSSSGASSIHRCEDRISLVVPSASSTYPHQTTITMTTDQQRSFADAHSNLSAKDIESNESSASAKHDSTSDLSQQPDASPTEQKAPEEKPGDSIEYPPFKVVLVLMACMFLVAFLFALDRLIIATVSTLSGTSSSYYPSPQRA